MNELMMQVGYLFLRWGFLENELHARGMNIAAVLTIPGMEDARRIRNAIAHGILEATAYPGEPLSLLCKLQDGSPQRVSFDDLAKAIGTLERAMVEIRRSPRSDETP